MLLGVGDILSVVLVSELSFGFDFERRLFVKIILLFSEIFVGIVDFEYSSIILCRDEVVVVVIFSDIVDVKVVGGIGGVGIVVNRGVLVVF